MRRSGRAAAGLLAVAVLALMAGPAQALTAGPTRRVSLSDSGRQSPTASLTAAVSGDGRFAAFATGARMARGDSNDHVDVFLRDLVTGRTELVTWADHPGGAEHPAVDGDGSRIAYTTSGDDQVWVRDRTASTNALISADVPGAPAGTAYGAPSISADGRYVAFGSLTSPDLHVYCKDLQTGSIVELDRRPDGGRSAGGSFRPQISPDGSAVTYMSYADDLVAGDTNRVQDVFLWRRSGAPTERVSLTSSGAQANGQSGGGDRVGQSVSNGGRWVAFSSLASNFAGDDTPASIDVFLRDTLLGTTVRVSQTRDGVPANGRSAQATISADGRYVGFSSGATNLSPTPAGRLARIFVWDRTTATSAVASVTSAGRASNRPSSDPLLSADGSTVVYTSLAHLAPYDTNGTYDVYATALHG